MKEASQLTPKKNQRESGWDLDGACSHQAVWSMLQSCLMKENSSTAYWLEKVTCQSLGIYVEDINQAFHCQCSLNIVKWSYLPGLFRPVRSNLYLLEPCWTGLCPCDSVICYHWNTNLLPSKPCSPLKSPNLLSMPHHGQWLQLLLDLLVSQNSTNDVAKFSSWELGKVESKWKANHRDSKWEFSSSTWKDKLKWL